MLRLGNLGLVIPCGVLKNPDTCRAVLAVFQECYIGRWINLLVGAGLHDTDRTFSHPAVDREALHGCGGNGCFVGWVEKNEIVGLR